MMQSSLAGGSVVFPSDNISLPGGTAGNTVQFDGGAAAPNVKTGSTTRNSSSKGIGVTNAAFHPRDVVEKRRINEKKGNDDQLSRGTVVEAVEVAGIMERAWRTRMTATAVRVALEPIPMEADEDSKSQQTSAFFHFLSSM
mmetsp:Transcript_1702/g.2608  ORF Transcript_1702/g.2608 Transcript_1702/m.2608 type:complete len:141 (+) Transcript_1702:778-1200(+)